MLIPACFKLKIVQFVAITLSTSPCWCASNLFGA